MAAFTGTPSGDTITPSFVSSGVVAVPSGGPPSAGADTIHGGGGDDTVSGGGGADQVYGDGGNDWLYGDFGSINALADGGDGNDHLFGGGTGTSFFGGAGDDTLQNDWDGEGLISDHFSGGTGNDTYVINSVWCDTHEAIGGGIDLVIANVNWTLSENFENIRLGENFEDDGTPYWVSSGTGNASNNVMTGNPGNNLLEGLDGTDSIVGAAGNDTLLGGGGNDTLNGGTGADSMRGDLGNDFYHVDNAGDRTIEAASAGYDTVYSTRTFTLGGNLESLYLIGSASTNGTGNALANQISGNSFVNVLRGLGGGDTFQSGNGADTVIGGTGNDIFRYQGTIGSSPTVRDTYQSGDGAVAFERPGAQTGGDLFDFSLIDANEVASGFQHLVFGTSRDTGRLWAINSGDVTIIRGNTDADRTPELEIAIRDGTVDASVYTGADFLV